jgi:hypothetical protein
VFVDLPLIRGFDVVRPLFELINGRATICGGYARYCASPKVTPAPTDDVDVYCGDELSYEALKAEIAQHMSIAVETNRAVTFAASNRGALAYCPKVQLIKPVKQFRMVTVGDPDTVIANFDFTVVRAAIISPAMVRADHRFLEDEEVGRLRLINIHCPISSTLRCTKYVERGYSLMPYDCLSLFLDWDRRDEAYRVELVEGLEELHKAYSGGTKLPAERLTALYDLINVD